MNIQTVKEKHPTIYKALLHIAYDSGCINRIDPKESLPSTPSFYDNRLVELEMTAGRIGDELETFCIGEETEINELIVKYDALYFGDFLNDWFETL